MIRGEVFTLKIINIEIYSPELKLLREAKFNENGLSIIFGDVEKPKENNKTSNSIGKTVLLKIVNVVFGTKNSGKDTIKGLDNYIVKAVIKENDIIHNIKLTIGSSKDYYIDGEKYTLAKYKEKFNINRAFYSKQTMLEKRKSLLSSISKRPSKEDVSTVLKMLYLDDIEKNFIKIKSLQDEVDLINKYKNNFKEDNYDLEKEKFKYVMNKNKIENELNELTKRLNNLKVSEDIGNISQKRMVLDKEIKMKNEEYKLNEIKIKNYKQIIKDSENNTISLNDVKRIYKDAQINISEITLNELSDVEKFYKDLIEDKNSIYENQIKNLLNQNEKISSELIEKNKDFDNLSKIISENNAVGEAIKIYDLKSQEKLEIESKISEINGKLQSITDTKEIRAKIDSYLGILEENFVNYNGLIDEYKKFIYDLFENIYSEDLNPYLNISVSDTHYRYKAMPVNIDLTFDKDDGEGFSTMKFLIFDFLIMNYTNDVDFLIEDSSCFESTDLRQIKNIILEGKKISELRNKQFIISLNRYSLDDLNEFSKYITLTLSEDKNLLGIKF